MVKRIDSNAQRLKRHKRVRGKISGTAERPRLAFSNTTLQKHQFFGAQPSSQSNSHIHTRPQEKP